MSGAEHFLQPLLKSKPDPHALCNARTNTVIASRVEPAFDSRARRKGLLGRKSMSTDEVLVIAPCNAIHTFFMRFAIDVVFVSRTGQVVKLSRNVRPGRIALARRAFAALEFTAGVIDRADIHPGDRLFLSVQSDAAA
jgi:uncharacterized membrane protein (UPF0127 family)